MTNAERAEWGEDDANTIDAAIERGEARTWGIVGKGILAWARDLGDVSVLDDTAERRVA